MCSVEVLLVADVMRRSRFHHNSVRPSARSVCRRLFTDERPSVQEISERLKETQEELNREVTKKWNFDFNSETPLPGRYQWVRVGGPAASSSTAATTTVEEVAAAEPKQAATGLRNSDERPPVFTQPKITDFMNHKKRHRTGDAILSPKSKLRRLHSGTSKAASSSRKSSGSEVETAASRSSNSPAT